MSKPAPELPLFLSLALLAASCAGGAAAADAGDELARCAAIGAANERLACYDALANRKSPPPRTASAPATPPEAAAGDPASFGLVKPTPAPPPGPEKIDVRVVSVTTDRQGHVTLTLDNGQTWAVQDTDPRLRSGDTVTIRHAALGSYLLTTPARHSYRVERLR
jgi:hypothetical protein